MALENIPETAPITTTVPVGQLQSQDYTGNLMNYGMSGVDPFEFVKMVQTGEVTFDSTDPNQQALVDQYERMAQQANATNPNANLPSWGSVLAGTAVSVGAPLVAKTFLDSYGSQSGGNFLDKTSSAVGDMFSSNKTPKGYLEGDLYSSSFRDILKNPETARQRLLTQELSKLGGANESGVIEGGSAAFKAIQANPERYSEIGVSLKSKPDTTARSGSVFSGEGGQALGVGLGVFGASLLAGEKPKQAAKRAVGSGVGKYLGSAIASSFFKPESMVGSLLGPVGAILGGALGGRVICNELMRQGIMDKKHVLLDYKFTRDYLTPTHVRGYHVWAVWMVKQMRKGKFVKFWKHVAGHRANEIAYIYGERDKPDYLGKVYRKILEPICWSVGLLCKKSDWSILYKSKEI